MRFPRHYQMMRGEMNLAPLIDVVLQLLIFFMLTSSFILQPGIKVNLPTASTTQSVQTRQVTVSVTADGSLFLNERPVAAADLGRRLGELAQGNPDILLVIKGDRDARHGAVVKVMDIARQAGIVRMAVGTTPEQEE